MACAGCARRRALIGQKLATLRQKLGIGGGKKSTQSLERTGPRRADVTRVVRVK